MITLQPIGTARNPRQVIEDDNWGGLVSEIEIKEPIDAEGLGSLKEFSHAEIINPAYILADRFRQDIGEQISSTTMSGRIVPVASMIKNRDQAKDEQTDVSCLMKDKTDFSR